MCEYVIRLWRNTSTLFEINPDIFFFFNVLLLHYVNLFRNLSMTFQIQTGRNTEIIYLNLNFFIRCWTASIYTGMLPANLWKSTEGTKRASKIFSLMLCFDDGGWEHSLVGPKSLIGDLGQVTEDLKSNDYKTPTACDSHHFPTHQTIQLPPCSTWSVRGFEVWWMLTEQFTDLK